MNTREKGRRLENKVVSEFEKAGFDAKRNWMSGQGDTKTDARVVINRHAYDIECKKKARGWAQLYEWTGEDQFAVICADRKPPLVVLRLETLLEMLGK